MCTETSVWVQNAYALFRDKVMNTQWICNIGTYIDNKVGHTFLGFWRKLKWFKCNCLILTFIYFKLIYLFYINVANAFSKIRW